MPPTETPVMESPLASQANSAAMMPGEAVDPVLGHGLSTESSPVSQDLQAPAASAPTQGGLSGLQAATPAPLHTRIADGVLSAFSKSDGSAGGFLRSALAGGLAGLAAASNRPPGNVPRGAAALGGFGTGATAAFQQANQQQQQKLENQRQQTQLEMEQTKQKYLQAETQARTYADQIAANNASEEGLEKRYKFAQEMGKGFAKDHKQVGTGVTEDELTAEGGPGQKYDHTQVSGYNVGEKEVMRDGKMVKVPVFDVYSNKPQEAREIEVTPLMAQGLEEAGYHYKAGDKIDSKLLDSFGTGAMSSMTTKDLFENAAKKANLSEDEIKAATESGQDMAAMTPYVGAYMAKHPFDFFGAVEGLSQQKGSDGQPTKAAAAAQRTISKIPADKMDQLRHERFEEQQKVIEDQNKARELALKNRAADGDIGSAAELLRSGSQAPSQLSKRSSTYQATIDEADKQEMAETGKHYSPAQEEINYKFANQPSTQNTLKYLNSLTGGQDPTTGNLAELVNQSNRINRTEFPAINKAEAWAKLESGDPSIAAYRAVVTEVSDQVAKILQGNAGGTSDAKMRQAQELFDRGFTKQQITAVANELRPLLNNRRDALIGDNRYLQHDFGKPNKAPAAAVVVEKPPENHNFNQTTWAAANPGKDVNAAIAAAKAKGYTVTQ